MYAKIYLNVKSFGKVIAKTKWCNFGGQCIDYAKATGDGQSSTFCTFVFYNMKYIPFHSIPSFYFRQRGPYRRTSITQEDRESVQSTENTQKHLHN